MSDKLKIFLSGGMTGLTEYEASHWRSFFDFDLEEFMKIGFYYNMYYNYYTFIDPTKYFTVTNNTDQSYEKEAMQYDLFWVKHSDIILVHFNSLSSIGTAQEIMYAYTLNKPIIGIIPKDKYNDLHPWYKEECSKIFEYDSDLGIESIVPLIYKYLWRFTNID